MIHSAGDFEVVFNENRDALFGLIFRMVREENTARDVLQDVFLNFFHHYREREMPDARSCRLILFRIARNLSINLSREAYTRKVRVFSDFKESYDFSPSESREGPEAFVTRKIHERELVDCLREIMGELDERESTALILRYSLEMPQTEIAEILEISPSAISRLLKRAVRNLLEICEKRGFQPDLG